MISRFNTVPLKLHSNNAYRNISVFVWIVLKVSQSVVSLFWDGVKLAEARTNVANYNYAYYIWESKYFLLEFNKVDG